MRFNIQKIRKNAKKIAAFAAVAALVSLAIFPAIGMNAESARFNFRSDDQELFKGINVTNAEDVYKDPVEVKSGDIVEGIIYYHNGVEGVVAENTRVKVNLPTSLNNGNALLTASISANNAETVTDTIVDGVTRGESGLTLSEVPEGTEFEVVSGSVKWYPNSGNKKIKIEQPLLNNQTGKELFSPSGLYLGDINGCWDYSGFVGFRIRLKQAEISELNTEKTVLNASRLQTTYSKNVSASQGETVRFKIVANNSGNVDLVNVTIKDTLPSDLSVIAGSAKLTKGTASTSISESELISANGVNIGTVSPAQIAYITFDAVAPSQITSGKNVINTAELKSGTLSDSDTASVDLQAGTTSTKQSKSAFNNTQNVDATKVKAKPGDEIEYTLNVKNTGSLNVNYEVIDELADVLEYADVTSISDSGILNSNKGILSYPAVEIAVGNSITRTFTVKVKNPLPTNAQNGFSYDYVMFNEFGDKIAINIEKPEIPIDKKPVLSVTKYVRNITNNETDYVKANTAYAGDMLEYKIVFKNTGNAPADYFKIKDSLPANVSLDNTVAAIVSLNGEERSVAENITLGYIVSTLEAGREGYIRFRATTAEGLAANETLKNVALLEDNGVTISDYAETIIKAKAKVASATTPSLPRTGGSSALMYAFIGATIVTGIAAYAYERVKK